MYLIYLDESGNSGLNLSDREQPIFCLCAMIVNEDQWHGLENGLKAVLDRRLPDWKKDPEFEVHASDLRRGENSFKGRPVADRIAFRGEWMEVGVKHGIKLIHRIIHKIAFLHWQTKVFGNALRINPHIAAFALLARCVDNYLSGLPGLPLGMFISDENREVSGDVEASIQLLKVVDGSLRLNRIVEKGFFIDSQKSLPLQLCDLFTLSLRKRAERKGGMSPKSFDDVGIAFAEQHLFTDLQHDAEVIGWLQKWQG